MEPIRSHDALFKFVFREPEQMAELLRVHLEPTLRDAIAWGTLTPVPGSFVDQTLRERHSDLLFTVEMHGAPVLLNVLAEHKSAEDRFTAWQLAGYVVRVIERWRTEHPDADHVPPVLPFVVHHGQRPWRAPRSPRELVDVSHFPPDVAHLLAARQLHFDYSLFDLSGIDETWLDELPVSPVTGVTLRFLQFLRDVSVEAACRRLASWLAQLSALRRHPRGEDVLLALFTWYSAGTPAAGSSLRTVMNKIQAEIPPMRSLLDELLELGEARGIEKGVQQGIEQGIERGMRSLLAEQLQNRFGPLSASDVARIAAADAEQARRWSIRVLTAKTCAEVLASE